MTGLKMNTIELKQIFLKEAKEIESYVIETRRHIHQYPETAFEEVKQVLVLMNYCLGMGIKYWKQI